MEKNQKTQSYPNTNHFDTTCTHILKECTIAKSHCFSSQGDKKHT